MRIITALSVLMLAAGSASACLNDATLESTEREFRSQYQTTAPQPEVKPSYDHSNHYLKLTGGGVLLVAAIALTLRKSNTI